MPDFYNLRVLTNQVKESKATPEWSGKYTGQETYRSTANQDFKLIVSEKCPGRVEIAVRSLNGEQGGGTAGKFIVSNDIAVNIINSFVETGATPDLDFQESFPEELVIGDPFKKYYL